MWLAANYYLDWFHWVLYGAESSIEHCQTICQPKSEKEWLIQRVVGESWNVFIVRAMLKEMTCWYVSPSSCAKLSFVVRSGNWLSLKDLWSLWKYKEYQPMSVLCLSSYQMEDSKVYIYKGARWSRLDPRPAQHLITWGPRLSRARDNSWKRSLLRVFCSPPCQLVTRSAGIGGAVGAPWKSVNAWNLRTVDRAQSSDSAIDPSPDPEF